MTNVRILIVFNQYSLSQFWFHTRAINKLPSFFEYFLNTPSHHRVHHGRNEYCLDKNYGGIFIIFDRLYGTFEPEQEMEKEDPIRKEKSNVVYGLTTPLKTFNPIFTQPDHFITIWQRMREISSSSNNATFKGKPFLFIWWNRLQVVFRGPGWNPFTQSYYECSQVLEPPSANPMYDPIIDPSQNYLATLHFLIIFVLSFAHLTTRFDKSIIGQSFGENGPLVLHICQYLLMYLSLSSVALIMKVEI